MCGIAGYIGYKAAAPVLLAALRKLEYRGYDSAGIAVLEPDGRLSVHKAKGELSVLEKRLKNASLFGTLGIAHTRWATHGEPSDINSHPHTNMEGNVAVVHNGIIENYAAIKLWLENRNVKFQSDTDTEVIAHLVTYYLKEEESRPDIKDENVLFNAVRTALSKLEGSYALAVCSSLFPEQIIAARKDCPLVVGLGQNEYFLASDIPAMLEHTREVLFLEDNELAVLCRNNAALYSTDNDRIERKVSHVEWDAGAAEKSGYPHFMLKEIHEQPGAIANTLRPRLCRDAAGAPLDIGFEDYGVKLDFANIERITLTACGTAAHAALIGKGAFEYFARLSVAMEIASEFRYCNPVLGEKDLVIVVSQSGETADTLAAMRLAKSRGAKILAITNVVGSTLAREAGSVLYTYAGPEIAVASTKAFTSQLVCLYLLALKAAKERGVMDSDNFRAALNALDKIPEGVKTALSALEAVQRFAARQYNKNKVFFMGRQFDYATAMESALKLKEINYTHSEAFAAGELKHGPIALVDNGTLVVALATQRALFDKLVSNIREVTSRGAASVAITWQGEAEKLFSKVCDEVFALPPVPDAFSPLLSIVPAQLFAYYCAIQRGNNPDKPRNLAKSVTVE
ncbi:MAG: glutamine--fructose-6-phosphate transaminase (isomerizing) [Spirochaetaceae bacterium]|jgi:glucosamine--fructose-6-phosphate aminotransferase (isomerizing)|nr:glutamine--fructose-6-phosphate transaminase (isomerizing) [Spirochaetaceae bacterium]